MASLTTRVLEEIIMAWPPPLSDNNLKEPELVNECKPKVSVPESDNDWEPESDGSSMESDDKWRPKMESDTESDDILNELSVELDNDPKGPDPINNRNEARSFNLEGYRKRLREKGGRLKGKFLKARRPQVMCGKPECTKVMCSCGRKERLRKTRHTGLFSMLPQAEPAARNQWLSIVLE